MTQAERALKYIKADPLMRYYEKHKGPTCEKIDVFNYCIGMLEKEIKKPNKHDQELIDAVCYAYGPEVLVQACEELMKYGWHKAEETPIECEQVLCQGKRGGLSLCRWDGDGYINDRNRYMSVVAWKYIHPYEVTE